MEALTANGRKHLPNLRTKTRVWVMIICLGLVYAFNAVPNPATAAQEDGGVAFRWAFGALVSKDAEHKLEPITADRALKTGDRLKMMVELQKECYVYVIYYGPQDQVKLLFPYTLSQLTTDYQVGKRYYIPQGAAWLELDQNVGSEAFHVLASPQRLEGLEAVMSQYDAAETESKPAVAKQVLAAIKDLKKQNRQLATTAERPINIGGNVRGLDRPQGGDGPDVAGLAQDVTTGGFYNRTFTIEHQ
jgi:hypothetical protein